MCCALTVVGCPWTRLLSRFAPDNAPKLNKTSAQYFNSSFNQKVGNGKGNIKAKALGGSPGLLLAKQI